MNQLIELADQLGIDERTLRRAASQGTLRAERVSPRKLRLAPGESAYLQRHWQVLATLRSALRTEPNVELAVVFGSVARGDDGPESDVDVLVFLREESLGGRVDLQERLEQASGREIHLVGREAAAKNNLLLSMAIDEGRVLVDRAGLWASLRSERAGLRRRAESGLGRDRRRSLAKIDAFLA